jgi:hypothetical protein
VPQRIKRLSSRRNRHAARLTDAVHSDAVAIRLVCVFTPLLFPDRQVSPGGDSPSERHRRQRARRLRIGQLSSLTRGDERNFL